MPASDYALAGAANSNSIVRFVDAGFTVGDANDLAVYIDPPGSGDEAVVENTVGQKIRSQVMFRGGVTTEPALYKSPTSTQQQ